MEKRQMKCAYFGGKLRLGMVRGRCECKICESNKSGLCEHILESSEKSAFFKHQPDSEYDSFYCGCSGWD